jgi:hypothetical protein
LTPSLTLKSVGKALSSLKLTITCLAALMVLVVACTLAQVDLGTFGAVEVFMRSLLVYWQIPGSVWAIPVFPGGALVGLVLGVNLLSAMAFRLEWSWKKAGLWVVHSGLVLFVAGEFVTSLFQVESQLVIEQGQTVNFIEGRDQELALIDVTDPRQDEVYSIPERALARGGSVAVPGTPVVLQVKGHHRNADLRGRGPTDAPSPADRGVGAQATVIPLPPVSHDNDVNKPAAFVEPVAGGKSYGTWLVSGSLGAPQSFTHEGRTYLLTMRHRRQYLPYSVTLKKFSHDRYAGTDIPKNFSSLVHLSNPGTGESRDVLIYMNQPLRYDGKAFYQASFGKGDTLSILQVVENPGWLLPYISCVLVAIGLIFHFTISLRRAARRREAAQSARSDGSAPSAQEA